MRTIALAACMLAMSSVSHAAAARIRVVPLDPSTFPEIDDAAINDRGDIAIEIDRKLFVRSAAGGLREVVVANSLAHTLGDIADSGAVSFRTRFPSSEEGVPRRIYVEEPNGDQRIAFDPGTNHVMRLGRLNATGAMVLSSQREEGIRHYIIYSDNSSSQLSGMGNLAGAFGVNDAGLIAGASRNGNSNANNWLYLFDGMGNRTRERWAGFGGYWEIDYLNNHGVALGQIRAEQGVERTLFTWDTVTDEVTHISAPAEFEFVAPSAFNDDGWFIAQFQMPAGDDIPEIRPYAWTPEMGFIDLNSLLPENETVRFDRVLDLNDAGEVLVRGFKRIGFDAWGFPIWQDALFVITIPSPSSFLSIMTLGLLAAHRHRS